jgi:hypothetical protein
MASFRRLGWMVRESQERGKTSLTFGVLKHFVGQSSNQIHNSMTQWVMC